MPRTAKLPAGMTKRGNTYHAVFRANGRLIRKRLSTDLKAARELLNELRARADKADFGLTDNNYPWRDLRREFLNWSRQNVRDWKQYESDLSKFEEFCKVQSIRQIDHELVIAFRQWRLSQAVRGNGRTDKAPEDDRPRRTVTPRTINRQVGTLSHMLSKGVAWHRIGQNPIADLAPLKHDTPYKRRRALTVAEVEELFRVSPAYLRPVWRLYMTTGIRRSELVKLRFDDVDFEGRQITIRASSSKNGKAREIPLDDETLEMIADLKASAGRREPTSKTPSGKLSLDRVFVSGANTPLRNNLLREFYRCAQRAGIEDAHPGGAVDIHSLRGTFTTVALESGATPKAVQSILGHSTLALTMTVYAKATERAKRDAVSSLPFARASAPGHIVALKTG